MKNALKNIWFTAVCILAGLILSIWFGKEAVIYRTAETRVSEEAYLDERHPPIPLVNNDKTLYQVTWTFDANGVSYTFETKEDHYPEQIEKKYISGYIDDKGKLNIISYDGNMGVGASLFIGPLIVLGGISGMIVSLKNYKKRKEEYEKEKAVIEERIATAEQFET